MKTLGLLGGALLLAGGIVLAMFVRDGTAAPADSLEARSLAVEQRLLCPQCTNKRLDVCELVICQDMRREIRTRLEAGESDQAVVELFRGRFGDRVLASVPQRGFNLWLWGWVAGSVLLVGAAGAAWLAGRARRADAPPPLDEGDERWLDAQLLDDSAPSAGR